MSSRPQFAPHAVITSGDMSSNITSQPTIIQKLSMPSYAISWTGTSPVGTLSVQVSNDYAINAAGAVVNPGTWSALTLQASDGSLTSTIPVSGNSGSQFIDVLQTSAYAIRIIYTFISGTGTLNATIAAKVA